MTGAVRSSVSGLGPVIALALLTACKEPSAPAPGAEKAAAPATTAFAPLPPSGRCIYKLSDTATEQLGDDLVGGHRLAITYALTRVDPGDAAFAVEAKVERVELDAKRDDYKVTLDSVRASDRQRIAGGADTLVIYDAVLAFTLIDHPLRIELDAEGRFVRMTGGDAVRASFLAAHPEAPKTSPHYLARLAIAASDVAIARFLVPSAFMLPPQQPLSTYDGTPSEVRADLVYGTGRGLTLSRARMDGERWLLESKLTLGPAPEPSSVPVLSGAPTESISSFERRGTVEHAPGDLCFQKAGMQENLRTEWSGVIDEKERTAPRIVARTLLYERM